MVDEVEKKDENEPIEIADISPEVFKSIILFKSNLILIDFI